VAVDGKIITGEQVRICCQAEEGFKELFRYLFRDNKSLPKLTANPAVIRYVRYVFFGSYARKCIFIGNIKGPIPSKLNCSV
jgi:hypothetical protein